MDTFTQALLGAAVGESVAGKQLGRKASAWGAFVGILPDLDILVRYSNPIESFTYHRSFSHSLIIIAILTPLLVWLARRFHPDLAGHSTRWTWLILLGLVTHVLLDALTIYGTQLFWPVTEHPFGLGTIFIIDPLYTLPLLAGCIAVLVTRGKGSRRVLKAGLAFSTAYLLWGILAQQIMTDRVERLLSANDIEPRLLTVTPAPFNSVLWRFIARVDNGYYDGFVSFLDGPATPAMQFHASADEWIEPLKAFPSAARLMWFTRGQFSVHVHDDKVIVSDLRMGVAPDYVFTFDVARLEGNRLVDASPARINNRNFSWRKLDWVFKRISDASLPLPVGNFPQGYLPRG